MSRILVTGLGLVTPFGSDVDSIWDSLYEGKCAIKTVEGFDTEKLYCKIAAEMPNDEAIFPMNQWRSELPKAAKFVIYGLEAAKRALIDANLITEENVHVDQELRIGVIVGAGIGGLEENFVASKAIVEKGAHRVSPYFVTTALINLVAGHIAIKFQIKGPNQSQVTACSTGASAIADGARMIKEGRCDIVVVGAAESSVCELGLGGFAAIKALASGYNETPELGSRPWDSERSGFVMGEGAGIVILESEEHAKKRGAKIYCEFGEAGLTNDAYHVTAPCEDGNGAMRAIKEALSRAKMNPEDVDYINAHATSTPLGDKAEMRAIKAVFGSEWDKISVSSVKGAIGHMLGASGAVESILTILSIHKQAVLPTLNLQNPDAEVYHNEKLVDLVPHKGKKRRVRAAIKNSFGFGGHNVALLFKEYK